MYLSKFRQILTAPRRMRLRPLLWIAVASALAGGALMLAGRGLPPPRFRVDRAGAGIAPLAYPLWRRLSDALAQRKYALLTFDDGPYGAGVDEDILDTLRKHHAHAVFFLVCSHLNEKTNHVLGEIEKAGDLVGNHSYDHPHLDQLNSADLAHQIEGCSARIATLGGQRPLYFRPPFGQSSASVLRDVQLAGMRQVLWNANSEDSWLQRPDQIFYWSLRETGNDSILLMHDTPTTAVALDRVLTALESKGFRFVLLTPEVAH